MYFPTSAARQLSSAPPLPVPHEQVIALTPSPRKTLFCALTKNSLSVWRLRVRPSARLRARFVPSDLIILRSRLLSLRTSRARLRLSRSMARTRQQNGPRTGVRLSSKCVSAVVDLGLLLCAES